MGLESQAERSRSVSAQEVRWCMSMVSMTGKVWAA